MNKISRYGLHIAIALLAANGCAKEELTSYPCQSRGPDDVALFDLPEADGLYVGKSKVTYIVQKSGEITNIHLDLSDVALNGKPLKDPKYERYAIESLRKKKLAPRDRACLQDAGGWLN